MSPHTTLKKNLIVEKYGGATLSDPQKIKLVAKEISSKITTSEGRVIVVSAMGQTTNQLIELAQEVSAHPIKREMDMLLSTGERISMSLLSIALNDLHCPAISFTGSQAGIFTSESHLNATVENINAYRVIEALNKNQIVILAGFQGVNPVSKEITTIGRGGSDLSAVAMSIFLQAQSCHILKDVPSVFTADPRLVSSAKSLYELCYEHLAEITFWGAKVLHYRSAELALLNSTILYIGPAASSSDRNKLGTSVEKYLYTDSIFANLKKDKKPMYETHSILSINSHENVLNLKVLSKSLFEALESLNNFLNSQQIIFPQILNTDLNENTVEFLITTSNEHILQIKQALKLTQNKFIHLIDDDLSVVTATCTGLLSPEIWNKIATQLDKHNIKPIRTTSSSLSLSMYCKSKDHKQLVKSLHDLIV